MENSNIERELSRFNSAMDIGWNLAKDSYAKIELALRKSKHNLEIINSKKDQIQQTQSSILIARQEEEIQELRQNIKVIRENINNLRDRHKDFEIIICGKATAGKTTLLEILIHGDSNYIEDDFDNENPELRSFYWHGLKVTEMPDFDFFKSETNNQRGFDAAKTADLVLFLMNNEKPKPEEIQCFAQLKSLGKPILGIINVKKNLNFKKRDAAFKELQKLFANEEEIKSFIANFKECAKDYDQDWEDIKFFHTHLVAAYHSHPKINDDAKLYKESRFFRVENFILDKVRRDGTFLRIKNFVDCVAIPTNDILLKIFEHSAISFTECQIWVDNHKKSRLWRHKFWERAQQELYKLFEKLSKNLKYEISQFVEENYKNKDFNEKWTNHIKQFGYVERYKELLESLSVECSDRLKQLGDELTHDLKHNFKGKTQTNIEIEGTTPWEKYADIVLPNISLTIPVKGWTSHSEIISNSKGFMSLFENKENLLRESKEKLHKQLTDSSFNMLTKLNNQVREVFTKQFLGNIDEFSKLIANYALMLARIGESQSEIAETLIEAYEGLNSVLFDEAISFKNEGKIYNQKATMRIPGQMAIVIAESSTVDEKAISELLGEKFLVTQPQSNWKGTMKKVLDCDFKLNSYQLEFENDNKTYSVIPEEKVDAMRLKLAQQISPYPILANADS